MVVGCEACSGAAVCDGIIYVLPVLYLSNIILVCIGRTCHSDTITSASRCRDPASRHCCRAEATRTAMTKCNGLLDGRPTPLLYETAHKVTGYDANF